MSGSTSTPTSRPHPLVVVARDGRDLLVSLQFTIVLLILSMVLIFAATLDQVDFGIWAVQEKYFRSFVVYTRVGQTLVPFFPGGYTIGGLLLINLIAAHVYRFRFAWRKTGIFLTHLGLMVLLVGELLTGLWQEDYYLTLDEGQTRNHAESFKYNELAVIDVTDPDFDDVVAIPESALAEKIAVQLPQLPFRLRATTYYPNSTLRVRSHLDPPATATLGVGDQIAVAPLPITYKPDERNVPAAFVEIMGADGTLGTFLVSPNLATPQEFRHGDRTWRIALRAQRVYLPDTISLLKFNHDRYAGTDIPKNFSSRLKLASPAGGAREVLIRMNEPLRHAGFTFYQAGFENNDRTTVLQVVRNPSWLMPYIACALVTLGLLGQFGIHLFGFIARRRFFSAGGRAQSEFDLTPGHLELPAGKRLPRAPRYVGLMTALVASGAVLLTFRLKGNADDYDVVLFGHQPVLVHGRIKPLDTVARTSILMLQGRQAVATADGRKLSPGEWLLDVLWRPLMADGYQTFDVVHPDLLSLLRLSSEAGAGGRRFSFNQLRPGLAALDQQAKLADATEPALRTPFQRAVVQLRGAVLLYQRLQSSLFAMGAPDFFEDLAQLEPDLGKVAQPTRGMKGLPDASARRVLEMASAFATMERFAYFRPVAPVAGGALHDWMTFGAAWSEALAQGSLAPAAKSLTAMGRAWHARDPHAFNVAVRELNDSFVRAIPEVAAKARVEVRFNAAQPFYSSAVLYLGAFLLAVVSWLRWSRALTRAAFVGLTVAFALATAGIVTRMWLEGRPPITNLYSSALFVGWAAVLLCIFLERSFRNGVGSVAGGGIGFATLLIAHHLSLGGDTMEMMRAVLDSNFWLATHVVTIAVGYSATFLAGVLALIYVARGVFTRSMDAATGAVLGRMIYGVVCFATLFSFVGTVLGGIWADQSWGRFWGWDPKENGALLIVIWNSIILHARWAGLVKTRGLASLAIFGNVVTAWSWFGVNMLGVGLHSYGFMDAAFWWLVIFGASQLVMIGLASIPVGKWRSVALAR